MSEEPSRVGRFLSELRRRRVVRVAVAYGVVGFVLVQVADLLFPALTLPPWAYSFVVALVLLGFPLAVALAWAFDLTPEGVRRILPEGASGQVAAVGARDGTAEDAGQGEGSAAPAGSARGGVTRALWFGAGIVVTMTGAWFLVTRSGDGPAAGGLDAGLIAVFPFRVTGSDPGLGELGEGMVELLAMTLTGTVGPRAVDPPTAIRAAQRAGEGGGPPRGVAVELARSLGARYTLTGVVVTTPASVTLSGTVMDAATGREVGSASFSEAPEALRELVDRLAGALLSLTTGESEERLPSLTDTPLPALLAYLEGQSAVRRGRFEESGRHFDRALEQDSTFALAALRKAIAIQWVNDPRWWDALGVAWRHRERLTPRDRLLLEAYGGPTFPEWPPMADWIAQIDRVYLAMPDRAELRYWLGDRLFHQGDWVGWPGASDEAVEHFRAALEMDSTLLEPMIHLVEVGVVRGDTAAVRRYSRMYFRADSASDEAVMIRWLAANALGDSAALEVLRSGIGDWSVRSLRTVLRAAEMPGGPLADAEAISAELRSRSAPRAEREAVLRFLGWHELGRGRPGRTAAAVDARGELLGESTAALHVNLALYWDGDQEAGARGAAELEQSLRSGSAGDRASAVDRAEALCVLGQWQAWGASPDAVAAGAEELTGLLPRLEVAEAPPLANPGLRLGTCARIVDAIVSVRRGDPEAAGLVEGLDRFFRSGPMDAGFQDEGPVILSRLWHELGETERALAAIRRRMSPLQTFRPPVILQEARLAAAAGERDAAVRLYEHYLRLRYDPEPALVPEAEAARRELAAIQDVDLEGLE